MGITSGIFDVRKLRGISIRIKANNLPGPSISQSRGSPTMAVVLCTPDSMSCSCVLRSILGVTDGSTLVLMLQGKYQNITLILCIEEYPRGRRWLYTRTDAAGKYQNITLILCIEEYPRGHRWCYTRTDVAGSLSKHYINIVY